MRMTTKKSVSGHSMRAMRAKSDRLDTLGRRSRHNGMPNKWNVLVIVSMDMTSGFALMIYRDVVRSKGIGPCYVCSELGYLALACSRRRMVLGRDKVTDAEQKQSTMKSLMKKTVSRGSKSPFGELEKKDIASCRWTRKVFSDPSSLLVSVVIEARHAIVW